MSRTVPRIQAGRLIVESLRDLVLPPFSTLLGLNLLLTLASSSLNGRVDGTVFVLWVILSALSIYVDIAIVLAAGTTVAERSTDAWIRAAFRIRCFWRFLAAEIMTFVLVVFGLLVVVVGGFAVGAYIALGLPVVALERRGPLQALSRSAILTESARLPVGIVFGLLILLPNAGVQIGAWFGADKAQVLWVAANVLAVIMLTAGTIAVTRAYVALGGKPAPAAADIKAPTSARPPRQL